MEGFGPLDVGVACRDDSLRLRIVDPLGDPFHVQFFDDVASLRVSLGELHCAVVVAQPERNYDHRRNPLVAHRHHCAVPVLFVADGGVSALRSTSPAQSILAIRDIEVLLRPAVRAQAIRIAATALVESGAQPSDVSAVLRVTCYDEPTPTSLKAAFARANVNRKTVWRHYRRTVAGSSGPPLKYVHEAIAVIRVTSSKTSLNDWVDVGMAQQVSRDWLREALLRQTGVHLNRLDDDMKLEYLQLQWLPKYLACILPRLVG